MNQRHSTREKRPPAIDDLGYTNREQLKRAGKGAVETFKKCEKILGQLKRHRYGGNFLYPVSVPGYTSIITEPMDLSTVEKKLKVGSYSSSDAFAKDIRKIWNNAWRYNKPGSETYFCTTTISDYFEKLMKGIENVLFTPGANDELMQLKKKANKAHKALKKMADSKVGNLSLQRTNSTSSKRPTERPMTSKERAVLAQNIHKLSKENPLETIKILKNVMDLSGAKNEVEFDLEKLSTRKCRKLEQSVKRVLNSDNKSKRKKIDPTLISEIKEIQRPAAASMPATPVQAQTPHDKVNKENADEEEKDSLSNLLKYGRFG